VLGVLTHTDIFCSAAPTAPSKSARRMALMLGEEETPPTAKERRYIRAAIEKVRSTTPDPTGLLASVFDKTLEALASGKNEVEILMPQISSPSTPKSSKQKTGTTAVAASTPPLDPSKFADVLESLLLKHRWHFETHEGATPPKYLIFFKIFGEVFGKRPSDLDRLMAQLGVDEDGKAPKGNDGDGETDDEEGKASRSQRRATSTRRTNKSDRTTKTKKDKKPSAATGSTTLPSKRTERHLRKRESSISTGSSSSRN